ncbi:myb-related transcription partner of profilin [Plakobranchus ocellatus]|uniref:Myb-related transcription partner of profilin n=1 Tax=Plakobranchus ocellatus TaxID=259542 RepID=A0AAV3YMC6_9GAST|nr:myb-related transcription partner of profilin [Plakobranchus ocellatus]
MPAHQVLNLISLVKENLPRLDGRFKGAGLGEVTNSQKRELWNGIAAQIHAMDPTFEKRSGDEYRKKWNDLRHQAMRYRTALNATGGGPPPKQPPFYEEIMDAIAERKALLFGVPEINDVPTFGWASAANEIVVTGMLLITQYIMLQKIEFTEKLFLHLQYLTLACPLHQFVRRLSTPPIPEGTLRTDQNRAQPQQGASSPTPIVIDEPCEPGITFDMSKEQSTAPIEQQIAIDPAKVQVIKRRRRHSSGRSMIQGQDDPKWEEYLDAMIEESKIKQRVLLQKEAYYKKKIELIEKQLVQK